MSKLNSHSFSGFTLIETLISLAIIMSLSVIGFQSFQNVNNSEALNKDISQIISVLRQARSLTLDSKNADQYGVHFENSQVVLFEGTTYISSDINNVKTSLNNRVRISSIVLSGGGSDIIFEQLTGKTSQDGNITLSLINNPSNIKRITVYKTGLAEIN
ncbi:MAG: prepilin-type N-terminal cleavage/methylation domain-containing protein [Candidatus Zambryskibacteria bacterium]|nr:prepilin-type N-terminal cleavage/methylation domain-containing protein [Candidatus Zambryskibacteria bacterium]